MRHTNRKFDRHRIRLRHEWLESRQLLAADLVITEFMAANSNSFEDGDGQDPDWIEILNVSDSDIDLEGWHLTDDSDDLTRWEFPAATIESGEFIVVFASGDDQPDAAGSLHTNFRLSSGGEYLALVEPDGTTIASQYGANGNDFPIQYRDVSYGMPFVQTQLIASDANVDVFVPNENDDSRFGDNWRGGNEAEFEAAGGLTGWRRGLTGAGQSPADPLVQYREEIMGHHSLVSYYTFDNDNIHEDGIHDVAGGKTFHGSATGEVRFDNGVGGNALSLSGNGYVELGPIPELQFRETGTIEAWIRPSHTVGGNDPGWFGTRKARNPQRDRYSLRVEGDYSKLKTTTATGGATSVDLALQQGEWFHVAVVFNVDDAENRTTSYFVNGERVGEPQAGSITKTPQPIVSYIGTSAFPGPSSNFVGDIDELAIYTDALDADTIRNHFAALSFPFGVDFVDLSEEMSDSSTSAYLRYEFLVDEPEAVDALTLKMRFDDGFAAYVNGVQVASQNVPDGLNFQSSATASQTVTLGQAFNATRGLDALRAGENILAIHGLRHDDGDRGFFAMAELSGTSTVSGQNRYFLRPTPGEPNQNGVIGFAEVPTIDIASGFYSESFEVQLASDTPGAALIYTTDGSDPSEINGIRVQAAVPIDPPRVTLSIGETTILRAATIHDDLESSRAIATRSYLFTKDIIRQPKMERDVIGPNDKFGGVYAATIEDDLKSLPVMSFAINHVDMFGPDGIYTNFRNQGRQWERPVSVEYFDADNNEYFHVDAGVRIYGADARGHVKKPFRLYFRSEYGDPRLNFSLFEGSPVDSFNQLTVRPGAHDAWTSPHGGGDVTTFQPYGATYMRDEFHRQSQMAMGQLAPWGKYVHLYINGTYWGMHNLTERPNDDFNASHLGGDASDWDVLSTQTRVVNGNKEAWDQMMAIAEGGLESDESYQQIKQYIDIDNFIDAMLVRIWSGDTDWMRSPGEIRSTGSRNKNWYAARDRNDGRFVFYAWDVEFGLGKDHGKNRVLDFNLTDIDIGDSPARLYDRLKDNADFRLHFADRLQQHFFHDGALTPTQNQARWDALMVDIRQPIVAEAARWGSENRWNLLFTPDLWQEQALWVRDEFFTSRTSLVLEQFREIGLYANIAAPEFSVNAIPQHGGKVNADDVLTLVAGDGSSIYYTVDGTDPRMHGGNVNPGAILYTDADVIRLTSDMQMQARALADGEWSAISKADFLISVPAADGSSLRISEIHYNPAAASELEIGGGFENNDDFEFIELVNVSEDTIDLLDVRLVRQNVEGAEVGVAFEFSKGSVRKLNPGERVVVVEDLEAFAFRYNVDVEDGRGDSIKVAGSWNGQLSNGGEQLTLMAGSEVIHRFAYDDEWYPSTDGEGFSLEIVDASHVDLARWGSAEHWRPSGMIGGTPGRATLRGNFDQDGQLTTSDIDAVYAQIRAQSEDLAFDLTADGVVNQDDVNELVLNEMGSVFGDVNDDGFFDQLDLVDVFQVGEYEDDLPGNSIYSDGDWNGDRDFTSEDLVFVFRMGGYTVAPPVVVISEMLAANNNTLRDQNGDSSDWIELYNPTDVDVALDGWFLTDDSDDLTKWAFPDIDIAANRYLRVFASGKDRTRPDDELHTNFRLRAGGEYLGLVNPQSRVVHEFAPQYPALEDDVSYGLVSETKLLFDNQQAFRYRVPKFADKGLGTDWTQVNFDDTSWDLGNGSLANGIGVRVSDINPELEGLFATDLTGRFRNATLLLRQPFMHDGDRVDALVLRLNVDDGFVAYLNGVPIKRLNAPATLDWNSNSVIARSTHLAMQTEEFDISEHAHLLRKGANVLAIHALNDNVRDKDLLLRTELVGYKMVVAPTSVPEPLAVPSPGSANRHGLGPIVRFDRPSGRIAEPFDLVLSTDSGESEIHYTTDGSQPNESSPVFSGSVPISTTTLVQAIVHRPGLPRGPVSRVWFTKPDASVDDFSSNLPLFVFENFSVGDTNDDDFQFNGLTVLEPDQATGRATLDQTIRQTLDVGIKVRGSSTATRDKAPYALEIWDRRNRDRDDSLLGLPADSDWALIGPFEFDRAMVRNTLTNELSRQMGRYAPRTRFVEVFYNRDGGDVAADDYEGIYFLIERIRRGELRVDIQALRPQHTSEPEISGGWILKRDRAGPGESGFQAGGVTLHFVEPNEREVTPEQREWITNRVNEVVASLRNPDPKSGYQQQINVDSWIDHHLLRLLTKEVDALALSTYFYMDRGGKVEFGPMWDSDRSMGADRDGRSDNPETWHFIPNKMFNEPWWHDLFQDPNFVKRWRDRWSDLRTSVFSDENIQQVIDDQAAQLREAQVRNFARWPRFAPAKHRLPEFEFSDPDLEGWEAEISHLKNWLARRAAWIDSSINERLQG